LSKRSYVVPSKWFKVSCNMFSSSTSDNCPHNVPVVGNVRIGLLSP